MKTIPSDKSNRCWTVAELPQPHPTDLSELEIYVNYTDDDNIAKGIKAVAIDAFVVPLFNLAPRLLAVVHNRLVGDMATMGLTPEEILEVKRLCGDHSIQRR